jgi:hypothetical protein
MHYDTQSLFALKLEYSHAISPLETMTTGYVMLRYTEEEQIT